MKGLLLALVVLGLGAGAYFYFVNGSDKQDVAGSRYGDGGSSSTAPVDSLDDVYDDPSAEVVPPPNPVIDDGPIEPSDEDLESTEDTWSGPLPETANKLNKSDALAKKAASFLATDFSQWLVAKEQLRKWVQTVDLMADGDIPTKNRPIDYKREKFEVRKEGDSFYDVAENHERWNGLVETITLIEPAQAAAVYRKWLPLLDEAYGELGRPGTFDDRFRKTLDRVINASLQDEMAELKQPHVYYVYADKSLEKQTALQKWIWRLGADNGAALQAFASKLRSAL